MEPQEVVGIEALPPSRVKWGMEEGQWMMVRTVDIRFILSK